MTEPPAEGLLFDMAPAPNPVERLLLLAAQYVEHNDTLDRLLHAGTPAEPDAHADSALRLASATRTAVKAVTDERLPASHDLTDAVNRLQQIAFLSSAAADQRLPTARTLSALAPETAMNCARPVARALRLLHQDATAAAHRQLTAVQYTALWEIACGHLAATSSLGRQYVRHRDTSVTLATLRSLQADGLAERVPHTAPSAYPGGPLHDRVRLTATGTTALAAALTRPSTARTPGTTPAPAPTTVTTAARTR